MWASLPALRCTDLLYSALAGECQQCSGTCVSAPRVKAIKIEDGREERTIPEGELRRLSARSQPQSDCLTKREAGPRSISTLSSSPKRRECGKSSERRAGAQESFTVAT